MTDASEWGAGVVAGQRATESVGRAGRLIERSRFSYEDEIAIARLASGMCEYDSSAPPRHRLHGKDGPMNEFAGGKCIDSSRWREVSDDLVHGAWSLVACKRWKKFAGIPELIARAAFVGVRHVLRNSLAPGRRLLLLVDSMSVACALAKGRSNTMSMARPLRATFALLLCHGASLADRRIASEVNYADWPLRG